MYEHRVDKDAYGALVEWWWQEEVEYWNSSALYTTWVPTLYRGADKSLARPISRCILLDGENISFVASRVYIYK